MNTVETKLAKLEGMIELLDCIFDGLLEGTKQAQEEK